MLTGTIHIFRLSFLLSIALENGSITTDITVTKSEKSHLNCLLSH